MRAQLDATAWATSAELAAALAALDSRCCAATLIGVGMMGTQYVHALRALGVPRVRLVALSEESLAPYREAPGVEVAWGGFEQLACRPAPEEVAIVATPAALLVPAVERLLALGFRRVLVEKPVSLWSRAIDQLAEQAQAQGAEIHCAFNRVAYPSFHETKARTAQEGGITSCAYTFTEMIKPDWPQRFPAEELARWGIANSLHVMSMAHGLIGWPATWQGHRTGALPWHPSGAVFVGSGVSERGIPFAYHADWGSTGRWSVEVHTSVASYRLCPLEKVFRRAAALADWIEIPVAAFAPQVKAGVTEQVAALLHEELRALVPLVPLRAASLLTRYGEDVCGYPSQREQLR